MIKIKKAPAAILFLCVQLFCASAVYAADKPIKVYLDNKLVDFGITNGKQVQALTIYDYAYVPIARIVEIMTGKPPAWNESTSTASFTFNGKNYAIDTRQKGIYIDGVFVPSPTGTPPVIINSRTLIPLKMLSNALGVSQNYDGATHSTWLTSPVYTPQQPVTPVNPIAPAPPAVLSVSADKTSVSPNETVNVSVRTNSQTDTVKITDSSNRLIREARSYRPDGAQNVFSLSINPGASGTYYVYAGQKSVYTASAKNFYVAVNTSPLSVDSVTVSNAKPLKGSSVTVTVVTSVSAQRVWLYHSYKGNFSETASGYTDYAGKRTWKINYTADLEGTQNFTAYAADSGGSTGNRNFTLEIVTNEKPVIHDAYPSSGEIARDGIAELTVITSANVEEVSFSVPASSGSVKDVKLSVYKDSGGRRNWYATYYPGTQTGTVRISVTALTASNQSASTVLSLAVRSGSPQADLQSYAKEVVRLINIERVNYGLRAFLTNSQLTSAANLRAKELVTSYGVKRPDGREPYTALTESGVTFSVSDENIGTWYNSPGDIVLWWMSSPDSSGKILNSGFNNLSVGVASDANGILYWVQCFTD